MRRAAERKRQRQLAEQRLRARTCPRKFGAHGVCGAALDFYVLDGRAVTSCRACERFERGICRDCPLPVAGKPRKARRCAMHAEAARVAQRRHFRERHRRELNKRAKLVMRQPEKRARNTALKRTWREANPDKVHAAKVRKILGSRRSAAA
jgi:hypothetical protein